MSDDTSLDDPLLYAEDGHPQEAYHIGIVTDKPVEAFRDAVDAADRTSGDSETTVRFDAPEEDGVSGYTDTWRGVTKDDWFEHTDELRVTADGYTVRWLRDAINLGDGERGHKIALNVYDGGLDVAAHYLAETTGLSDSEAAEYREAVAAQAGLDA